MRRLLRGLVPLLRRESEILGWPGLLIAFFAVLCLVLGLRIWSEESDRLRRTGRDAFRPILAAWVRTIPLDYLGSPLPDYVERWRLGSDADQSARRTELEWALQVLGSKFDPLVELVRMELRGPGRELIARWREGDERLPIPTDLTDRLPLPASGSDRIPVELVVRYRLTPEIEAAVGGLEVAQRRLLLALLVLSCFPLLFLLYMALQARTVHDRISREAAQKATIDLADRTCHELGNMAFVLGNEHRNLTDHLDLVERFLAEYPGAAVEAATRAGLPPEQAERIARGQVRALAARGLEPAGEMDASLTMARDVCRQIAICSEFIAMTVRELDGYLRQTREPLQLRAVEARAVVRDAETILGPRLRAASVSIEEVLPPDEVWVRGDRRLLVHAVVNLLKNALEAVSGQVNGPPRLEVEVRDSPGLVAIEVRDNGPGIAPAIRKHLFESGRTTKGEGRGRGLATVADSLRAMGGQVEAEDRPGGGACFRLLVPRTAPPARGPREADLAARADRNGESAPGPSGASSDSATRLDI